MRKPGLFSRAVILLVLFALTFVGLPFGLPVSSGQWPSLAAVFGWSTSEAAAATPAAATPVARAAVPPRPARLGQASSLLAKPGGKPARVRELGWMRTPTSKRFEMSDGSTQLELSAVPLHYRDGKGKWRDIDTKLVAGSGADAFKNTSNVFDSRFGKATDRLVTFEAGGTSIALGAVGEKRPVTPKASGSTVTFPDVFGTADVRYAVSPSGVKEDILLAGADEVADEYSFELRTNGLVAQQRSDGSIAFVKKAGDKRPVYVMPAPFMYDASDKNQPEEPGFSDKVTQTLTRNGGRSIVAVKPDQAWLADEGREFPVVIDPTITVAPAAGAAQDALLTQADPSGNYGTYPWLTVGRDSGGLARRSLVQFDLSSIPANATIRSADVNLHMGSPAYSDTTSVPMSVHEATAAWSEGTATWSSMASSFDAAVPFNRWE